MPVHGNEKKMTRQPKHGGVKTPIKPGMGGETAHQGTITMKRPGSSHNSSHG